MNTNRMELSMKELEMVNGGMSLWEGLHYVFISTASGAVVGGGIGSTVPVVGTVIGGALGAGISSSVSSGAVLIKLYSED